jgi:glycosyltransferase involved in cell wall biosynthesis
MTEPQQQWVALLGWRDFPTDGVEDYCVFLARALAQHGVELKLVRAPWAEKGWSEALRQIRRECELLRGQWVLVQYTALAWSRRGFPWRILSVLRLLKSCGLKVAVVFHDTSPYVGRRLRDRVRTRIQGWLMRKVALDSDRSISVLPAGQMAWVRPEWLGRKFVTIPIGANIPESVCHRTNIGSQANVGATVVVFGVTGGQATLNEVSDIAHAVKRASEKKLGLRLVVLGRGSKEAESPLKEALRNVEIEVSVLGLLPAAEVANILADADVMLFVRGHVSVRRGSALAGIVSGLPVVGYSGPETTFPLTEAGLELAPEGHREALASALSRVLTDHELREELRRRSARAHVEYFSWNGIAQQLVAELGKV